jgi:uncharacterized protein
MDENSNASCHMRRGSFDAIHHRMQKLHNSKLFDTIIMPPSLGNPAPFGLFCFGMTGLTLRYVETGWAESDFDVVVAALAVGLGGFGLVLVGIFEFLKGNSFSFAVFEAYGAFWWTYAILNIQKANLNSTFGEAEYSHGMALYLAQWGVLTLCFWVITWRKNIALVAIFSLLACTFFLLALANGTGSEACKVAGGYTGFVTALGAMYTGAAELINEEYGRMILPGLAPLYNPQRFVLTKDAVRNLIHYDQRSNTMWLRFRGLHIRSRADVDAIREAVVSTIQEVTTARTKHQHRPTCKVHVIADYDQMFIAEDMAGKYWTMAFEIEREFYLSVTRFHVSSFGTRREAGICKAVRPCVEGSAKIGMLMSE